MLVHIGARYALVCLIAVVPSALWDVRGTWFDHHKLPNTVCRFKPCTLEVPPSVLLALVFYRPDKECCILIELAKLHHQRQTITLRADSGEVELHTKTFHSTFIYPLVAL